MDARTRRQAWLVVSACLCLGLLPASAQRALRARLLDLQARLARLGPAAGPDAGPDAAARAADAHTRLLEAEVDRLRRALLQAGAAREVVRPDARTRLIPAETASLAGPSDLLQRVVLARGRVDGVEVGQLVLSGRALVGQVLAAGDTTCEARLVTDPTFRVRAAIPRPEGDVDGLLRGDGGADLLFVPAIVDATRPVATPRVGEAVLCSRESLLCGLEALLGVVVAVEEVPGSPLPQARVRPACDLARLDGVAIVRRQDEGHP